MINRREAEPVEWDELFEHGERLDTAVALGAHLAVKRHKSLNQSIVIWRDGGPVSIPASQIDVGETPEPHDPTVI